MAKPRRQLQLSKYVLLKCFSSPSEQQWNRQKQDNDSFMMYFCKWNLVELARATWQLFLVKQKYLEMLEENYLRVSAAL